MRVLVVGGGGREHAIAWKLAHSPRVTDILVAPGNAGTAFSSPMPSRNVPIPVEDIPALVECALEQHVDFTVIGPDNPLAEGIVDAFTAKGLRVFGPTQAAARLEWSKAFAKTLMREIGVPTADFRVFEALEPALGFVRSRPFSSSGFVIKADGLALGKGVIVCDDLPEAEQALERMFEGEFGVAGARVLVEERLNGPEVSALCFTDGQTVRLMVPARDHKRALDGDQGPNTGGMGAFAPAPDVMPAMLEEIQQRILEPVVHAMRERGTPYQGVLYAGLMLTPNGIQVIEFNARFGDPETQVLLPMLETDLLDVLEACVNGTLGSLELRWRAGACATVAIASPGYPGVYRKGLPITGLEAVPDGVTVFHAGTKRDGDAVLTNGGRVLNVTAMGSSLEQALGLAYQGVASIHFDGMHYRRDIGRAVSALPSSGPGVDKPNHSYALSGVNIAEGARAVELMKTAVKSTHDARVLGGVGAFGGVLDVSSLKNMDRPLLVASTDGVGTKTMVAAKLEHWDGIGADIVNHGINDILVQGAKPLFFMDYVAASNLRAEWVAAVVSSMARACREAGCVLLGGETAEMPGVYREGESDVVGTMVGTLEHAKLIDGSRVTVGDAILALPSSGLHTNGYSLARRALDGLNWREARADLNGRSIGEALLEPHRSYLPHVQQLEAAGVDVRAMAHITGGGLWDNVPRTLPAHLSAVFQRGSWPVPPIFHLIAQQANLTDDHELHHAFNMGIGMTVVIPKSQLGLALKTLENDAHHVGEIRARDGVAVLLE